MVKVAFGMYKAHGPKPPKFNSLPLKNDGWKTTFLLGRPIFRGYGKFPGCNKTKGI